MKIGDIYGQIDFPLLLLLGQTLISQYFPKRKFFYLKLIISWCAIIGANFGLYFFRQSGISEVLSIFTPTLIYLLSIFSIVITTKASIPSYLMASSIGYCLQNMSYCLMSIIRLHTSWDATENWYFLASVLIPIFSLIYFVLYWFYLRNPENRKGIDRIKDKRQIIITFVTCAALSIISTLGMGAALSSNSYKMWLTTYLFNTTIGIISITSELELLRSRRKASEATRLKIMHLKDKESYEQINNNIELVNIKMHDLKHRLNSISDDISVAKMEELKKSLNIYETYAPTQCQALDLVLTEKSLQIANLKIHFTCFVDAKNINYIPKEVLYSIFENILSNAIKAVETLPEEKRIILLKGTDYGDYLGIHIENHCLENTNTLIGKTTNEDKINHGFGLRSIQLNVEQYGGKFSANKNHDIFSVDLMFKTNKAVCEE